MTQPIIISIEGNIGAGKTTIVEKLQNKYIDNNKIVFLKEPVGIWESISNNNGTTILEKFYENPSKYSFAFQVMAFATRSSTIKNAIKQNPKCEIIICERSLEADNNIFAKMLKDDKKMEDVEYKIYELFYNNCKDDINLNGVIYIDSSPDVCLQRINKRNRNGENDIAFEYLQKCQEYHDNWLVNKEKNNFPVIRIDTNEDVLYDENDPNDKGILWIKSIITFIDEINNSKQISPNKKLSLIHPNNFDKTSNKNIDENELPDTPYPTISRLSSQSM